MLKIAKHIAALLVITTQISFGMVTPPPRLEATAVSVNKDTTEEQNSLSAAYTLGKVSGGINGFVGAVNLIIGNPEPTLAVLALTLFLCPESLSVPAAIGSIGLFVAVGAVAGSFIGGNIAYYSTKLGLSIINAPGKALSAAKGAVQSVTAKIPVQ